MAQLSPAFLDQVQGIAGRLGTTQDDLLHVMNFETGGSFAPNEVNRAGSGATGLLQFMPSTAQGLGTTTEALGQMTAEEQLPYVEKYLTPYKGRIGSLQDLYMAVLHPRSIGQRGDTILFRDGTRAYQQNAGLDADKKGHITISDAVQAVMRFVGLAPGTAQAATLDTEMARETARARAGQEDDVSQQYLMANARKLDDEMAQEMLKAKGVGSAPVPGASPATAPTAVQAELATMQPLTPAQVPAVAPEYASGGLARVGQDALQVVGGVRDAVVNTLKAVDSFSTWFEDLTSHVVPLTAFEEGQRQAPTLAQLIPEVPAANTVEGPLIRSATQFLTAFLPATSAVKALGITSHFTGGLAAGALTDLLAFDPQSPRMSNLINELAPALFYPITDYLAAKPEDGEAEGRLKNALEGLALGVVTNGLFAAVQAVRQVQRLGTEVGTAASKGLTEGAADATGAPIVRQQAIVHEFSQAAATRAARPVTDEEIAQQLAETATPTTVRVGEDTTERLSPSVEVRTIGKEQAQQFQALTASGAADTLPTEGRYLHINFDHIQTGDDLKQTIATVAEVIKGETDVQRRGVQSLAETEARAAASPFQELDRILGIAPGTALNAEDALAVRQVWLASADRLHTLSVQLAKGDIDLAEAWLKQFVLTANIHVKAMGVTAEAGRAMRVFGVDLPSTDREFLASLMDAMLGDEAGAEAFRSVGASGASQTVQALAAKVARLPNRDALGRFVADVHKTTGTEMFTELWYGALLSALPAHVVNGLDGALRVAWAIPERYLTTATGNPRELAQNFQAANAFTYGLKQGLQEAWGYAREMWKTGVSQFGDAGKIDTPLRPAVTAKNLGIEEEGMLAGFVDLLGEAFRTPGRSLMTMDEWWKAVNYRMQLHENAFRQASFEGLDGQAMALRIVALTDEPLPRMKEHATAWANYQTLGTPLTEEGAAFERLGRVTQHLVEAREELLPLKIVLPFVRTPFNIARFAAEHSPLGLLSSNVRTELMKGGPEGALARSKLALGSASMTLFGLLAMEDRITGKAPADPAQRAAWERLGKQEYSLRVGDTYYAYNRLDLIGLPMGLAADFVTIARETSLDRLDQLAGAIMGAIFNNLTSKTYLQGIAEAIDATTPGRGETDTESGRDFARFLRQRVASLIPSGVALVARTLDPVQRDTRTITDALLARIPGMSVLVPPKLDLWGRVRLRPEPVGPDLLSPFMSRDYLADNVDEELLRQQVPIRMPERVIKFPVAGQKESEEVELTPTQYNRYVELSAGLGPGMTPLKDQLRVLMLSDGYALLSDGPRRGKSLLIQERIGDMRETAKVQLRQEDNAVHELLLRQEVTKQLSRTKAGEAALPGALRNLGIGVTR